jgi:hypothetical protein
MNAMRLTGFGTCNQSLCHASASCLVAAWRELGLFEVVVKDKTDDFFHMMSELHKMACWGPPSRNPYHH